MTDEPLDPFDPANEDAAAWEALGENARLMVNAISSGRMDLAALRAQTSFKAMVHAVRVLDELGKEHVLIALLTDEGMARDPGWLTRDVD